MIKANKSNQQMEFNRDLLYKEDSMVSVRGGIVTAKRDWTSAITALSSGVERKEIARPLVLNLPTTNPNNTNEGKRRSKRN